MTAKVRKKLRKPKGLPLPQWYRSLNEEDRARVSRACVELLKQSLVLEPDWDKRSKVPSK